MGLQEAMNIFYDLDKENPKVLESVIEELDNDRALASQCIWSIYKGKN